MKATETEADRREYLEQLQADLAEIERLSASVRDEEDPEVLEHALDAIADIAQGEEEEEDEA